jgi:uncharacterized protein (DUF488 family)
MTTIYTIGHSTRPIEEFISLLKKNGVTRLIDIRTVPRSRHNPQYEQTALETSLPDAGIEYRYMKDLGGLRPKVKDSINMGWHNGSFRNYADYMQTDAFAAVIKELIAVAKQSPTAIMCAEAVPWRCHRSLVGDALVARDIEVLDIMSETSTKPHTLTSFAVVDGTKVTYPNDGE